MRDTELYQRWKATRNPDDLEAVIDEMSGMIHTAAMKYANGVVPMESLRIKGRQLAAEAVRSYDESKGMKLSVWVHTYLEKLNRFYSQNGIVHVSEDMFNMQSGYFRERQGLSDELGRDPTVSELADAMSVPEKKILQLEKVFAPSYNDSSTNTAKYLGTNEIDAQDLLYAYQQLSEEEQRLFKLKTGWPSGKQHTLAAIAKKTGMSVASVSRRMEDIAGRIKMVLGV